MEQVRAKLSAIREAHRQLTQELPFDLPFQYEYSEGTAGIKVDLRTAGLIYELTCAETDATSGFAASGLAALDEILLKFVAWIERAKELNAYCRESKQELVFEVGECVTRESYPPQPSMNLVATLGGGVHAATFRHHNVPAGKFAMFTQWADDIHERNEVAKVAAPANPGID